MTLDSPARHFGVFMDATDSLLVIWHSRTGTARAMADAAMEEAGETARLLRADAVEPEDLMAAAGYLFICPENLATMTGMMKDMFDRTYYPALGKIEGRAFATIIKPQTASHSFEKAGKAVKCRGVK